MIRPFLTYLIAIAFLLSAFRATASEFMLKRVGLEEGLSHSSVRCLLRDSRGYLWAGTSYGLNRYDNETVANYFADSADPDALPSNDICFIVQSSGGHLLVGTMRGLVRYDYPGDRFEPVTLADGKAVPVRSALAPGDGRVLIGGPGRLFIYDDATGSLTEQALQGGSTASYLSVIGPWRSGKYLLRTRHDGLWQWDVATGTVERLPWVPAMGIRGAAIDDRRRLWVASTQAGLQVFDSEKHQPHTIAADRLASPIVLDLLAHDGRIWIATEAGINIADPNTMEVGTLGEEMAARTQVATLCLAAEDSGNIYAGTLRHGVTCIYNVPMRTISTPAGRHAGNPVTVTSMIAADGEGNILVGLDGDGVARFNRDRNALEPIASTAGLKVTSLAPYGSGRKILVATYDRGFYLLDPIAGTLAKAPATFDEIAEAAEAAARSVEVYAMQGGKLALVTDTIFTIDPERPGQRAGRVPFTIKREESRKLNTFMADGSTLLMHDTRRVWRYDAHADTVGPVVTSHDAAPIIAAATDGHNRLWLTDGKVIRLYDLSTGESVKLEVGTIRNITSLAAEGERLWVGADNRLYMIKEGNVSIFTAQDGVSPNQFINKATLLTPDYLFMGGINGLLKIGRTDIDNITGHDSGCEISLQGILVDGRALRPGPGGRYTLPADYASLTVKIVDRDHQGMRSKLFRYYIEGPGRSDTAPIETTDRQVTYNKLRSGRYYISVSCSRADGTWSEPVRIATLRVPPPLWASWWAIALYLLSAVAVAVLLVRIALNKRAKQLAKIERHALEEKIYFLERVNSEVRTPLSLVISPLSTLVDRLRDSDKDPDTLEALESIYDQSLRIRNVIDNLPEAAGTDPETLRPEARPSSNGQEADDFDNFINEFDASALTAVVFETDRQMLDYLCAELKPEFKAVKRDDNASDAQVTIKNTEPDIVIIGTGADGKTNGKTDGLELCKWIKNTPRLRHIPVIVLSQGKTEADRNRIYRYGADSLLFKPFHIKMLICRCKNLLRSRSIMRSRYGGNSIAGNHEAAGNPQNHISNSDESFMLEVNRLIDDNISDPDFGVDSLAKKMLMSRTAFYNRFRRVSGKSVGQYITEYRLKKAERSLLADDTPISEIAETLGFRSQRYFSTFFKEKKGMTPSQFRASKKEQAGKEGSTGKGSESAHQERKEDRQ